MSAGPLEGQAVGAATTTDAVAAVAAAPAAVAPTTGAPESKNMERSDPNARPGVRIEPLTMAPARLQDMERIEREFKRHKRCCLCCPIYDSYDEIQKRYTKYPERLPYVGLAINEQGEAFGLIHITTHGMKKSWEELSLGIGHDCKPGEAYVEGVAVMPGNRGKGAGKALMAWADDKAREAGMTHITLGVINGNRARGLYEHLGYRRTRKKDECDECCDGCCTCCVVCCAMGPCVYSYNPLKWNCGAINMEKQL